MDKVRIAIVGLGVMGRDHLKNAFAQTDLLEVVGVNDVAPGAATEADAAGVPYFRELDALLQQSLDAVIVSTPHPQHEEVVLAAAERRIHILCEKPIAATASAADRMVAACQRNGVLLAMDFQMRASPVYRTVQRLLNNGTVGELARVAVVATNWYRTQAYYDSGSWRGTWEGEGGGVLMNQAAHDLDLYCWLAGTPQRVTSTVHTRVHRIETENTVSALLEHEAGRVDTFVTTTAEYPGRTEWTFAGDRGVLVCDGTSLRLFQLDHSLAQHILADRHGQRPAGEWKDVAIDPVPRADTGHVGLLRQFARAIHDHVPPLATGEDGVRALDLANAMILSGFRDRAVEVPIDRAEYDFLLHELRQREV